MVTFTKKAYVIKCHLAKLPRWPPSTVLVIYECPFSYSIILDLHFPSICYRKLLTPPVVPANDDTTVGIVTNPNLDDLAEIMPEVAHSMKEILDYKGDVCEDLLLSFEVSIEEYGKVITKELTTNGRTKNVTNDNR